MSVHLFGIRHHGPGCARALRDALPTLRPDCLLVEGPPDAQSVLPLMLNEAMQPPVALLVYMPDQPQRAVYYPFTHFSPEWQALRYGLSNEIPTRFFDLPQSIQFAREQVEIATKNNIPETANDNGSKKSASSSAQPITIDDTAFIRDDPLALLAEAAGYTDHDLWWEHQIEQRQDMTDLFAGILEAMTALRKDAPPRRDNEQLREASMRQHIRTAQKEGFQRIAVVCGAWHAPALDATSIDENKATDVVLLKGLPTVKVMTTWIPWTNSRLAYRSGYGAGVTSPGWYSHLWNSPDRLTIRWLAYAAQVLRTEGFDTSSANVIEAVRLAETLASLRNLPMPGLAEMHEATQTVLCNGQAAPMQIIRNRIEIGEMMGAVPAETPAVPLHRDIEALQRRLHLDITTEIKLLELDQRKEVDLTRSHVLHRLNLLGIEWGKPARVALNKQGTFWENWTLQWQIEFIVRIIEANVWGNTVELAASAKTRNTADVSYELPTLTDLLNKVILADLPDAVEHVLQRVQTQSALTADIRHLMLALPPLVDIVRQTDVRQTKAEVVLPIIHTLVERIIVGLPSACSSLDDDAAQVMAEGIDAVTASLLKLNDSEYQAEWHSVLTSLTNDESFHGLIRGQGCRLLLDAGILDDEGVQQHARHALSTVTPAPQAAAWITGILRGNGDVLLTQYGLWSALDNWLRELDADTFVAMLPLLRRSFAQFNTGARRRMGEYVKRIPAARTGNIHVGRSPQQAVPVHSERAALTLPVLRKLLGVNNDR